MLEIVSCCGPEVGKAYFGCGENGLMARVDAVREPGEVAFVDGIVLGAMLFERTQDEMRKVSIVGLNVARDVCGLMLATRSAFAGRWAIVVGLIGPGRPALCR